MQTPHPSADGDPARRPLPTTDLATDRVSSREGSLIVDVRADDVSGRIIVRPHDPTVQLHFAVRHLPVAPERRQHLVDVVFAQPELDGAERVEASVPLGDADLIWRVERHLEQPETRAAGSTCLLDGRLRPAPAR